MLASPLSKGLFHRAMAQSGGRGMVPRERAEKAASRFIRALLVADGLAPDPEAAKATLDGFSADALRTYLQSKSFSDMLRARKAVGVPPALIADGVVLPREGGACFDQGNYNKVPTILGMTRDESKMRLFLGRVYRRVDDATYTALAKLSTDMTRVSGCDSPLRAMSAHRDQPGLYGYQFVWGASPNDNPIPAPYDHRLGSYHALDIAFFFRVWSTLDINQLVFNEANLPGREALSDAIMDYMAQFARTGNPNRAGSGLPEWTAWSAESGGPKLLLLDGTANAADIAMNNEELSAESIRAWLADLPQSLRDAVLQASAAPQDNALAALP
jgi:para-nitrobenzyl esterase